VLSLGSIVNGKYRLARLLGDGGMGSVYEAHHAGLGTRVAIKVLHPDLARRTGLVERFLQEARVAAQIRSPHVVQVTDVDRTSTGQAYIVMELLEGEPLAAVLERQHKLPVAMACAYTLQILAALEAAHALGVIHRDLKPENVFVTFAGGTPVLKLIDFGIAKARRVEAGQKSLTVAGVVMGTAEYMAPEQARSADKVDARADLYAAGVMLYEMIAGARPVNGDDARVIALRVERGEIVPLVQAAPDVPREIAGLVHRAMAARPELRFATATEMRLALERASTLAGATAAMGPAASAAHRASMHASAGSGAVRSTARALPSAGSHRSVPLLASSASPAASQAGAARPGHDTEAPPVHTLRAAPIPSTLAAHPVYGGAALPAAPPTGDAAHARRRGQARSVALVALVALPLLLGAGIVAVLLATGTWASSTPAGPPWPSQPVAIDEQDAAVAVAAGAQAPQPSSDVPRLVPTRAIAGPSLGRPASSGRPTPSAAQDAAASTSPPPFAFPSGLPTVLPPFPSSLPFPTTLPSAFPTAFPSAFPSAFPGALPGWPAPAPAASASATPSAAPSASGPGY
jgi:eukaryotic-like serine/threonine-protein kinase